MAKNPAKLVIFRHVRIHHPKYRVNSLGMGVVPVCVLCLLYVREVLAGTKARRQGGMTRLWEHHPDAKIHVTVHNRVGFGACALSVAYLRRWRKDTPAVLRAVSVLRCFYHRRRSEEMGGHRLSIPPLFSRCMHK